MNRFTRIRNLSLAAMIAILAAAGPEHDAIRAANAAFLQGDLKRADALYAQAEERSTDPGLVAFNRAAVMFEREEFREAELHYTCVLEDAACPPERAARAWFNRGICLLRRGGAPVIYRSAALCFEHCLNSSGADDPLKAEARHKLELAKLLWLEANKTAAKPEQANDPPPRDIEPPPPTTGVNGENGGPDQTAPKGAQAQPRPTPGVVPKESAKSTDVKTAGNNTTLPVLTDDTPLQQLSPEDAREYLRLAGIRLRQEREKMNEALRTPERPGVRDW